MYIDKNSIVGGNSLEKRDLTHSSYTGDPGKLDEGTSELVILSSNVSMLGTSNGRQTFPIIGPAPLVPSSMTGRQSFPSATSGSTCHALDPINDENYTLQPIITPLTTTDEILGIDKRKIQLSAVTKNMSAASLKSDKVLTRFWGDEQDTDATDSAQEPKIDSDLHKALFPNHTKYLVTPHDTAKKSKRGRPKKLKSPKDTAESQLQCSCKMKNLEQGHEVVNTRLQTGSKSQTNHNIQL